ncbi:MAG TPA: hypothetical protein PKY96_16115 [Flavobacteriales bacterium]|nr:hypothetical protein [Flavobacteriales bacterium]
MRALHHLFAALLALPMAAREYVVPVDDVAGFFAKLPKDATRVSFSAASVYKCNADIVLPVAQLLVIDGAGAKLVLGPKSNGFTRAITDQKEALARTSSRYTIRDFASIEGGKKAIDLKASLGSVIENLRCVGQSEAAIDLRFCLMARVSNVLVTNPLARGIVVRHGDWPGATWSNSQSNHTVLQQCRVYCAATTTQAFSVLHCSGVRMLDCISEGAPCDHDLFLSAAIDGDESKPARNTVVKQFALSNFHVEHAARKASIHVNMPPRAAVDLDGVYWNGKMSAPVIDYISGQLNLSNVGWWDDGFVIATRVSAPRINIDRCHAGLKVGAVSGGGKRAGALQLRDALPGSDMLKLDYVRLTRPSM